MRTLLFAQVITVDYREADLHSRSWWQPAKLLSVTAASLSYSAVPAAAQLAQLRVLELTGDDTVNVQPLSALHHLSQLRVYDGPATGLRHLPSLRSLSCDPYDDIDLDSLQRQTQLTALTLHVSGRSVTEAAEEMSTTDLHGLCTLTALRELSLLSMHLSGEGAGVLNTCSSLTRLDLSCASRGDPSFYCYLGFCCLRGLDQLKVVCLRDWSHEAELAALDLRELPGLQCLVLEEPSPLMFGRRHPYDLPNFPVPMLEVVFAAWGWDTIDDVLHNLARSHRAARRYQQPIYGVLRMCGWPAGTAPQGIQASLNSLLRHRVRVETDGPGGSDVFTLHPDRSADDSSSESDLSSDEW